MYSLTQYPNIVPETDRCYVWWLVKNFDIPRHTLIKLLQGAGLTVYDAQENQSYISRYEFRLFLAAVGSNLTN